MRSALTVIGGLVLTAPLTAPLAFLAFGGLGPVGCAVLVASGVGAVLVVGVTALAAKHS